MKDVNPQFLNIDFDIFTSVLPKYLIRHFDRLGISFLYSDKNHYSETHEFGGSKYLMSLEVNFSSDAEAILSDFTNIVQNLHGQMKDDWNNIDGLVLDFGYNILENQSPNMIVLSSNILRMASNLHALIKITTYNMPEEQWEYDSGKTTLKDQINLDSEPTLETVFKDQVSQSKLEMPDLFEQAHQILLQADPLDIQTEYEVETSEILELLKSDFITDPNEVSKIIEAEFRKWAMIPDSHKKSKFASEKFALLWLKNRARFKSGN